MASIYDFNTGMSFDALSKGLDDFHDWVMEELKVFASKEQIQGVDEIDFQYDAELILCDPYQRFSTTKILFCFEDVNLTYAQGLSELRNELLGIELVQNGNRVCLRSSDGEGLRLEANSMSIKILS